MTLCICLDDRDGIRFHGRRQSRDRAVCRQILTFCKENGGRLITRRDARVLFPDEEVLFLSSLSETFVFRENDFLFSEDLSFLPPEKEITRLIVYRWNRLYPSDCRFSPKEHGFILSEKNDFVGHSHEKITEEIYCR